MSSGKFHTVLKCCWLCPLKSSPKQLENYLIIYILGLDSYIYRLKANNCFSTKTVQKHTLWIHNLLYETILSIYICNLDKMAS